MTKNLWLQVVVRRDRLCVAVKAGRQSDLPKGSVTLATSSTGAPHNPRIVDASARSSHSTRHGTWVVPFIILHGLPSKQQCLRHAQLSEISLTPITVLRPSYRVMCTEREILPCQPAANSGRHVAYRILLVFFGGFYPGCRVH